VHCRWKKEGGGERGERGEDEWRYEMSFVVGSCRMLYALMFLVVICVRFRIT